MEKQLSCLVLLVYLAVITTQAQFVAHYKQRLSQGVIFKQQRREFLLVAGKWDNIFALHIPSWEEFAIQQPIDLVHYVDPIANDPVSSHKTLANDLLLSLMDDFKTQYSQILSDINLVLPQYDQSRTKRTLFDLSGFFHEIVGTPSSSQIKNLKSAITNINNKQHALFTSTKVNILKMSSILRIQNKQLTTLANATKALTMTFAQDRYELMQRLDNTSHIIEDNVSNFTARYSRIPANTLTALNQYRTDIYSLFEGRLSPSIIPPSTIAQIFADISRELENNNLHYTIDPTIQNFYKHARISAVRHGNNILISTEFPIYYREFRDYQLYQIIKSPLPIRYTNNNDTELSLSQLDLPHSDFLVINEESSQYIVLSTKQLNNCYKTQEAYLCTDIMTTKSVSDSSCEIALFYNIKKDLNLCSYTWHFSSNIEKIVILDDNSLLLINTSNIKLQCPETVKSIPDCKDRACIAKVNICNCILMGPNDRVFPRYHQCHAENRNVTILHPRNVQLLRNLAQEEHEVQVSAKYLHTKPASYALPRLNLIREKLDNVLAKSQPISFKLKNLQKYALSNEPLFESNMAKLQYFQDTNGFSIWEVIKEYGLWIVLVILSIFNNF